MNSRQNNFEAIEVNKVEINKKLEDIIEKIFLKCISDKENKLALGIAIDSRRIDKVIYCINTLNIILDWWNLIFFR